MVTLTLVEQATVATYDEIASTYAAHEPEIGLDPDDFDKPLSSFCAALALRSRIIDIGCGAGRAIPFLRRHGGTKYVGIDPSIRMIAEAHARFPAEQFHVQSLGHLRSLFPPETFEAFFANASLMHVPRDRMTEALRTIRAVLKRGGFGFISVPCGEETTVHNSIYGIRTTSTVTVHQWTDNSLRPHILKSRMDIMSYSEEDGLLNMLVQCI